MAIYSEFSHEKWWFSIATLNYQRVFLFGSTQFWRQIVATHQPEMLGHLGIGIPIDGWCIGVEHLGVENYYPVGQAILEIEPWYFFVCKSYIQKWSFKANHIWFLEQLH